MLTLEFHSCVWLTSSVFTVHTEGVEWAAAGAVNACSSIVTVVTATGLQSFIRKQVNSHSNHIISERHTTDT